jgi:hypothetical protein
MTDPGTVHLSIGCALAVASVYRNPLAPAG